MTVRIGVDTGGTFTDVVLFDQSTGEIHTTKTPSTPPEFDRGVLTGIEKILRQTNTEPGEVSFLCHGTTVGTNAILEEEIPRLGLITNVGLRDVIEIGDQTRPELYDLQTEKPPELIPRSLRKEAAGRIDSQGNLVEPIDEAGCNAVIDELVEAEVSSIVVSMLFSYLNDTHERQIGELIEAHEADIDYALSSAVHPEIREYERTITTVLNEAIKTTIQDYLARLVDGIDELRVDAPLNIIHSGGGVFSAEQATERAIRTVTSGPAAGAVAALKASRHEEYPNAIGMDMGGTSADVSIVRDGELVRSTEGEINDLPVKTPMIDISTVGAGGGSIAWIDEGGLLHVGPQSASADPGPICYDQGGSKPTITDANLLLGRLDPDNFLEGDLSLNAAKTRDRFQEVIARPLDQSVEEAALSVIEVANASIARNIHRVTVERGDDPSQFVLVGFGGAGPLQAPEIARRMDINTVVIPQNPGVFSARGILIADVRMDESRSYGRAAIDPEIIENQFEELTRHLLTRFESQGFAVEEVTVERALDMRYRGQSYELNVPLNPDGSMDVRIEQAKDDFHAKHERLYGHSKEDETVEVVTLRINGQVSTPDIGDTGMDDGTSGSPVRREVYFDDIGYTTTEVYERRLLEPGTVIDGPAILSETGSTTIVPPDASAEISPSRNVIISLH